MVWLEIKNDVVINVSYVAVDGWESIDDDSICAGSVRQADGSFKPAEPIFVLADAQARAKQQVVEFANQLTATITAKYPDAERALWSEFEEEAKAFQGADANNRVSTDYPALSTMLAARLGKASDEAEALARLEATVPNILAKATQWKVIAEHVAGLRAKTYALIDAATNQTEVSAALAGAKAEAEAVAKRYGLV